MALQNSSALKWWHEYNNADYDKDTMMFSQGLPGFIAISREIRSFRAHYDSVCQKKCDEISQLNEDINQRDTVLPQRLADFLLDQFKIINLRSMRRLLLDELVTNDGPLSDSLGSFIGSTISDYRSKPINSINLSDPINLSINLA